MLALWPVSPHSSHIVVCIRGQSFRLWPFGSSVPSQLVHWCSGHAKLKALLWVVLPHSLHFSIRGQSFRLWPFGSSVPWQSVHCVQDTRRSKRFCGSCCRSRCMEYISMLSVRMLRTCCTRGTCTLLVSVYAQILARCLHSVQRAIFGARAAAGVVRFRTTMSANHANRL